MTTGMKLPWKTKLALFQHHTLLSLTATSSDCGSSYFTHHKNILHKMLPKTACMTTLYYYCYYQKCANETNNKLFPSLCFVRYMSAARQDLPGITRMLFKSIHCEMFVLSWKVVNDRAQAHFYQRIRCFIHSVSCKPFAFILYLSHVLCVFVHFSLHFVTVCPEACFFFTPAIQWLLPSVGDM